MWMIAQSEDRVGGTSGLVAEEKSALNNLK